MLTFLTPTHAPIMSDADETGSVVSTASSIHDTIVSETERKHNRLKQIRERRKLAKINAQCKKSSKGQSKEGDGVPGGIMSVRTLNESLHGGSLPDMRKLRRKITIKVKTLDNHSANGTTRSTEGDSSEHSSVMDQSIAEISTISNLSNATSVTGLDAIGISFADVQIREYQLVPGSNPSVSSGPPVELGWAHTPHTSISVNHWEMIRDGNRRLQAQMKIPPDVRRSLLLHHGSAQRQIRDATREAAVTRKQRLSTMEKLHREKSFSFKKMFKKDKS